MKDLTQNELLELLRGECVVVAERIKRGVRLEAGAVVRLIYAAVVLLRSEERG